MLPSAFGSTTCSVAVRRTVASVEFFAAFDSSRCRPSDAERGHGRQGRPLVALFGERGQTGRRQIAGAGIAFVADDRREDRGVANASRGGAPDARVLIVVRQGDQRVLIGVIDLVEAFEPNGRIGVLPLRLGAEFFEESHGRSPLPAPRPTEPSNRVNRCDGSPAAERAVGNLRS